eukprot:4090374-Pyramimonas_sp.AAC.1
MQLRLRLQATGHNRAKHGPRATELTTSHGGLADTASAFRRSRGARAQDTPQTAQDTPQDTPPDGP